MGTGWKPVLRNMRTLAIDLGTKRIGLALSDEGGRLATPYDVLTVNNPGQAIIAVNEIARREGVARLVIGLPLNMDGTVGGAAKATIRWAKLLEEQVHLPIVFVD